MDVAVHEALHGAALHELGIQGPAETQNQNEGEDRRRPARGLYNLEVAPVELGLAPRLRLEPDEGQPCLLLFNSADIIPDHSVAARVARFAEPIENSGGLVVVLLQKVPDHRIVRLQDR